MLSRRFRVPLMQQPHVDCRTAIMPFLSKFPLRFALVSSEDFRIRGALENEADIDRDKRLL